MRYRVMVLLALMGIVGCNTLDPRDPGNLVPKTVAEDPGLPAVEMNGSRFHLETFGNPANPAIVFLHGGPGGDYRGMRPMAGRYDGYSLADEYFLVFWDQRGAGLSQRHDKADLTLERYLQDLDTLVDRYSGGRPVYLVGHSWGGMFATAYINRHPDKVAGAVLIEPGPLTGAIQERIKNDIFDLDLGAEWLNDWAWNTQFFTPDDHARMDYQLMLGLKNAQPRFHENNAVDPEPVWREGAAANRYLIKDSQDAKGVAVYDFTANLSRYTTPVLFITGGLSEILGASLQRDQLGFFPSASLTVIPGAGHDVEWTHTAETITAIHPYLDSRKGGTQ